MASSSAKSYDFQANNKEFRFVTEHGISYVLQFFEDETFNSISQSERFKNVYQVVLIKTSSGIEPLDIRVSATIKTIIEEFLDNEINSIIYFCSNIDSREQQRFNAFNRWYSLSEAKNEITKIDNIIHIDETLVFSSLMLRRTNPMRDEIIEIFDILEEVLNQPKP